MRISSIALLFGFTLSACGGGAPTPPTQIEGPPVKTLTPEQVNAALVECNKWGRHDDPRVKYTPRYCAALEAEHDFAPTPKSNAKVDPTITRFR